MGKDKYVQYYGNVVGYVKFKLFFQKCGYIDADKRHHTHENLVRGGFKTLAFYYIHHQRCNGRHQGEHLQKVIEYFVADVFLFYFLLVFLRKRFKFVHYFTS